MRVMRASGLVVVGEQELDLLLFAVAIQTSNVMFLNPGCRWDGAAPSRRSPPPRRR